MPGVCLIDNLKAAITKACYHDPQVQHAYADCAEDYGFMISPCPVADPKKKGRVESGDFGLKPLKIGQDEDLHELIAERYERNSTIITSNLDLTEWGDAFPNKLLGAATLDRLRRRAYQMAWEGPSYRAIQQPAIQTQNDA